jgi:hypothetical protein
MSSPIGTHRYQRPHTPGQPVRITKCQAMPSRDFKMMHKCEIAVKYNIYLFCDDYFRIDAALFLFRLLAHYFCYFSDNAEPFHFRSLLSFRFHSLAAILDIMFS